MSSAILKKLAATACILLGVWAFYLYRQVPHSPMPFAKASSRVEEISMEQGMKNVDLKKQGGAWKVLADAGSVYKADENAVKTLISDLKEVQIEDEISDRADRADEYEVTAESGTRVRFFDARKGLLAEGLFGKQAPDGSHLYFRYPEKPDVFLARGLYRGELGKPEPNAWRSHQLIDIPEAKILGITLERKGMKTDWVRLSTDVWTSNGQPVASGAANALVGILAHLRADDFADPSVASPLSYEALTYARIQVKSADAAADLRVGTLDAKAKRYPVSTGKTDGTAWISQPSLESLFKNPASSK